MVPISCQVKAADWFMTQSIIKGPMNWGESFLESVFRVMFFEKSQTL